MISITVVDCIVRLVGYSDKILRIEDCFVLMNDVINRHWIHMMDDDLIEDLIAFDSEVQTKISSDYFVSNVFPFRRSIESLIEVSIETESGSANRAFELKVVETLFESLKTPKFRVSSNPHSHHRLIDHCKTA